MPKNRPSLLRLALVSLAAVAIGMPMGLAGCASGDSAPLPPTGERRDAGSSTDRDTSVIAPAPDTSSGGGECGAVCCVGALSCIDSVTVGECNGAGTALVPTPCPEGQECVEGVCATPRLCEPGSTSCYDATTVLVCRQSGDGHTTRGCEAETTCFQGRCVRGRPTGEACSADDECASGTCRCGSSTDDNCPGAPASGYCAEPRCDGESCPSDGACFDASAAPLGSAALDHDHCVRGCPSGACADPSLSCVMAPVHGPEGPGWEPVCYLPGYVSIGEECGEEAPCIGGDCLRDYYNTSYCTRRCDDEGLCPEGFGCVALRAGEFWCSELCGDGSPLGYEDCPFDAPERFDVTCRTLPTYDGGSLRACATTS